MKPNANSFAAIILGNELDPGDFQRADDRNEVLAHRQHPNIALKIGDRCARDLGILRKLLLGPIKQSSGRSALRGGNCHFA